MGANLLRRALTTAAALIALNISPDAHAAGTATDGLYKAGRGVATGGIVFGVAGPPVLIYGVFRSVGGLFDTAVDEADGEDSAESVAKTTQGIGIMFAGAAMTLLGPSLVSSGSLMSASAVHQAGGDIDRTAGWVAAGGAGLQAISLGVRISNAASAEESSGGMVFLGFAGWTTGMTAGIIQHIRNRSAYERLGSADLGGDSRRLQVRLVPTAEGASLVGRF